jgi:predicted ATPase
MATRHYDCDERHRVKAARNRALIRDGYERIDGESDAGATAMLICECGDLRCNATLELTVAEYEAVRAVPIRFPIKPGHDIPSVERVVARHERYTVVQALAQPS